jgi:membrane protein implicated in regulation of membrane protease activity
MRTLVKMALDLRWVVVALSVLLLIVGFRRALSRRLGLQSRYRNTEP